MTLQLMSQRFGDFRLSTSRVTCVFLYGYHYVLDVFFTHNILKLNLGAKKL